MPTLLHIGLLTKNMVAKKKKQRNQRLIPVTVRLQLLEMIWRRRSLSKKKLPCRIILATTPEEPIRSLTEMIKNIQACKQCLRYFKKKLRYNLSQTLRLFVIFWHFVTIYGTLWYFLSLLWLLMALCGTFGLLQCFVENSFLSQSTHFFK